VVFQVLVDVGLQQAGHFRAHAVLGLKAFIGNTILHHPLKQRNVQIEVLGQLVNSWRWLQLLVIACKISTYSSNLPLLCLS
jgi:hypothetical protein